MNYNGRCRMPITTFELQFRVDTLPVPQPRPRVAKRGNFATAYTPANHAVHDFKCDVKHTCQKHYLGDPLDLAFFLSIEFYFKRPGNKIWKTKSMPREYRLGKPDLDNLIKPVKDCLTGIVWTDDSRVVDIRAIKFIGAGTYIRGKYQMEKPGCDILIRGLTERVV